MGVMDTTRIALIIDKSEGFVNFQKHRYLSSWGIGPTDVKIIDKLAEAGGADLFGDVAASIKYLKTPEQVKQLNEELKSYSKERLVEVFGSTGLLVLGTVARTSTGKLEKFFKESGFAVHIPPAKNESSISEKILSELSLSYSLKNLLQDYVGEDYDSLLPLVQEFSTMSESEQRNLTEEDIFVRLPQNKGAIPPWDIEKFLFKGDIVNMIRTTRRVVDSTAVLVPLAFVRNKIFLGFRISALVKNDPYISNDKIAEVLGESSGKISMARKYTVKNYSAEAFTKAAQVIDKAERDIKGGSAVPPMLVLETALVQIAHIFKENR